MLLYIHIPFCDSKCHYCSFNSFTDQHQLIHTYMHALHHQLKHELNVHHIQQIDTLFIGGGTPSCVDAALYEPLFALLEPYSMKEITTEANPNSATLPWLRTMRSYGVNRVSLGVQSFNAQKLKRLGRAHSSDEAINAVYAVEQAGIAHCSIDLIYGNRFDTTTLMHQDVAQALALPIDHLSAYALSIESGTVFEKQPDMAVENETITQSLFMQLRENGFTQYEISNFGRYQSQHNLGYWQQQPYLGIGAGAVGCINQQRYYPHRDIASYIASPTHYSVEAISAEDWLFEHIFLGLRSNVGVAMSRLNPTMQTKARTLLKEEKLVQRQERLYNPNFLLSDELALFITA